MPYTFNGESYRTEDEANQARQQYINDRQNQASALYADAASVGFDETRFGRLLDSGYGLSQMSDSEKNYISKNFLSSENASTAYTKSAVDQYLSSVGLPPSSMLGKYRTAYSKYAAGGGIADNYGSVTEAQWKKINELWQKDWEYGLTDTDYARKAAGLAPESYDDMYEDTQLDAELKAAGLPPSKLLNGKLGETYNKWVADSNEYARFNEAVARRYYEQIGFGSKSAAESAADNIMKTLGGTPSSEYTYEQAFAETLSSPEWGEFASEHFGAYQDVPDQYDEKYIKKTKNEITGKDEEELDADGNPVYDTEKWLSDYAKASKSNAKIDADEFAITLDKAQQFFQTYGANIRADIATEQHFEGQKNIKAEDVAKVYVDYLAAYSVNDGKGYTLEDIYPGIELTAEERKALQPFVDKANYLLLNNGYESASQYFASGEYSRDVKSMSDAKAVLDARIIAQMRKAYEDVPTYAAKSDEEVLHQYYESVGKAYLMSDEDITKLQNGEITLATYLRSQFGTPEEAWAFADKMRDAKISQLNLPTDDKALVKAYEDRKAAEDLINLAYANHYYDEFGGVEVLKWDDETFNAWANEQYMAHVLSDENLRFLKEKRNEIREADSTFYDKDRQYTADEALEIINERALTPTVLYYADVISYTDDFINKTSDMDYVNQRFNQIANSRIQGLTLGDSSKLWTTYATDEEKRKLVYLADESLSDEQIKSGIVHYPSITYGRSLLHNWDAQRRIDKQTEAGKAYVDMGDSFIANVGDVLVTPLAYLYGGVVEGVWNLGADTVKMIAGKELLSSERLTYFSDVTGNIASDMGTVGSFAFQMVPSMVQSAGSMALAVATDGASEAITLAIMASEAYSSSVDQALRNGADPVNAYLFGLASGVNEALFEKVSLDFFVAKTDILSATLKTAQGSARMSAAKAFAVEMLKRAPIQGLVEGSEELFTSIANNFAEGILLGYDSAYNKTVEHYLAGGMSQQEAESKAMADVVKSVMMDFVGGLVSGMLMSFGSDMVMGKGGRVFMDTTGIANFMKQTVNLSQISAQDAVAYAQANLAVDANGKYTADSAKSVFTDLIQKGADAATLLRVRTELFTEENSTPEATTPIETMIAEQRTADKSKLLKSAEKYVYNKKMNKDAGHAKGKSAVSIADLTRTVNAYVDELSGRVSRADIRQIDAAMTASQAEFFDAIDKLAGFKSKNSVAGAKAIGSYRASLSQEAQNTIAQSAEKYKTVFNTVLNGADAAHYSVMAATIEYAASDGNALKGLNSVFGGSASVSSNAIANACLNEGGKAARSFIDRVCEGIALCGQSSTSHLFEAARNGVASPAYIATQMALARSMPENSMSRAMYDHIMKYGATAEALDLLTAANMLDTQSDLDKHLLNRSVRVGNSLMTAEQIQEAVAKYAKAEQRYTDKLRIAEAHRQADAQALASENARIAGQEETVRVLDAQLQETQGSDKGVVDALAKARNALAGYITARDNLVAEQNKRRASTESDLKEAKNAYDQAAADYKRAMIRHSAAYVQRLGAQLETIKAKGSVNDVEFKRVTADVMYGTADNLNDVDARIISAEKTAAVALGRALGVDVECVEFTPAFFASMNVANPDLSARGTVINGKVYLNTKTMTSNVGSLTDQVVLHEIGHVLELSADNYKKFAAFAQKYFTDKDGAAKVKAWLAQQEQKGMSKDGARKELVAEFARQVALADPRAVSALCKSAPRMSMRVFQWLNNTKARMSAAAKSQSLIVDNAQRAFAQGLKAIRNTPSGSNETNVTEFAPNRTAMDNAIAKMQDRVEYEDTKPTKTEETTPASGTKTESALGLFTQANERVRANAERAKAQGSSAQPEQQTATATSETPVEEQRTTETPARRPISPFSAAGEEALRRNAPKTKAEVEDMIQRTTAGYTGEGIETVADELVERDGVYYDRYGNAQDEHGNAVSQSEAETAEAAPVQEPVEDFAGINLPNESDEWQEYLRRNPVGKRSSIKGETLAEGEYYYDEQGNAYDENGNLVNPAHADTRAPAPTVDNNNPAEYNDNGGQKNGPESSTEQSAATDGSVQGLSGRAVAESNHGHEESRAAGQRDSGSFGESVLTSLSDKGIPHVRLNQTNDAQGFYDRIGAAKQNNPYGAFVTQHEVTEYSDMHLYLDETGTVGVAVTSDGNIVSVFKNPNGGPAKAVSSIILTAIQNGGVKLDNFNSVKLSTRYIQHGFVPVSRTAFVDEFAPSDWNYERDGRPDIVFWVHNGDSLETIAQKIGSYENPDFDSLPMFDDYDQAEAYRDNLITQRAQQSAQAQTQPQADQTARAQLPFELTAETRQKIMRVVASMRTQNADADGRVPKRVNDTIAKIVKNQVTHDANYVDTPSDVLDAFADRFKAPEQEATQGASSDSVREYQQRLMQDNGQRRSARITGAEDQSASAYSEIQQGYSPRAQYYTEYDSKYIDMAQRYESGDKSVKAALRKLVDAAARKSGYTIKGWHGSDILFNAFDKNKIRAVDYDAPFNGFWFSSDKRNAAPAMRYANVVREFYLNIENPAPYDVWKMIDRAVINDWNMNRDAIRDGARSINDEVRYRLQDMGYDGVHYSGPYIFTGDNVAEYNSNGSTSFYDVSGRQYDLRNDDGYARLYRHNSYDEISPYDSAEDFLEMNENEYKEEDVWVAFEPSQIKSADLITYDSDGNIIPLSERFRTDRTGEEAWMNEDVRYYTEYDPQTQAVADAIENMTDLQSKRNGRPTLISTDHGYVVSRVFNTNGLKSGDPMMNMFGDMKKLNVAMIAPVSEFVNGDVGRAVPMANCTAIVTPNTDAYAETRADARAAGAGVYVYDESDPTQFDRAIERAANMQTAEYMPAIGYDEWLKEYNAINPESSRPIPQQTKPTNRVHKVVQTAADSTVTTDETYEEKIPSWLQRGTGTYTPISNERTLNKARGVIERAGSLRQAVADLHHDVAEGNGRATDLLARAELLYAEMQNDNTLSVIEQERIFGDLCLISSDAGRALQLVSELKNMTPEGHIEYIEQVGRKIGERHQRRTGKPTNIELTDEEKDAYRKATTKEEVDEIDKEVATRWAEETRNLGILDKIRNWRYFAMLGNPRTHFRNMIGNTLMFPIARAKDSVNTLYQLADVARGKMTQADRTTTFFTTADAQTREYVAAELKKALPVMQGVSTKYIEEATKIAQSGEELSESKLREIWRKLREDQPSTHITNGNTGFGRFINALSSFNTNALELEDALFLGLRFKSSMYQQIQAKGLDINNMTEEQHDQIVNYAMEEALRATFRDASALADALNKLARTNKATELAMEAVLPFKKTPINIAKRSIEYSPLGLIQGAYKMISNNSQYQKEIARINAMNVTDETREIEMQRAENKYKAQRVAAIDRLAAGTTGSVMYMLGIIAASLGWVSIGKKDDEESQFEQSLGKNNYSLNIGDVSIDLSAFSPAAVPLLMGTATWNAFGGEHEDGEPIVSGIISALAESVDPITEMSMLSGIADALSGSSYSNYSDGRNTRWFGTIAGNALESYVGQFVPTFVGQTARALDPYTRSYSAGNDYWASKVFGSEVGGAVKNLQNKVGLGWLSEPKVNLHGEEQKNYTNFGSWVHNAANNWVLPATIKVDQKNEIDDELVRLYGVVDNADIFPTKPSRNIGSYKDPKTGKNVNLKLDNDTEYMEYQKEVGQTTYDLLEDLMQSRAYQRMTDDQKADAIEKIIDQAKSATKKRWKAQMIANRK